MSPREVCLCDRLPPAKADQAAAVESIVDAINAEWRGRGVTLIEADLAGGVLLLRTGPGPDPLTRARVRAFLTTREETAA
ncbi:hypothetical protein [Aurantimonas coralicida]|uniref:hypothetical protein n=1 Tax=Aurantimonas coralicida TaxID=182270 RepID=UPI0023959DFA|nr:hypothetical protein [Aurantimonas coralicida]MDE0921489.1 hypothetical protein [Aurantimonas coralicida]